MPSQRGPQRETVPCDLCGAPLARYGQHTYRTGGKVLCLHCVRPLLAREDRYPKPHEQWATLNFDGSICLWGDRRSAFENCDPDERVCRVRIEVLSVVESPQAVAAVDPQVPNTGTPPTRDTKL